VNFAQKKVVVIPLYASEEPEPKTVFLTKGRWDGNLGGVGGADLKCQAEADETDSLVKGKKFKAWIAGRSTADSIHRHSFQQHNVPYVRVDGMQIASSYADLIYPPTIGAPINVFSDGSQLASDDIYPYAWTGAYIDSHFLSLHAQYYCQVGDSAWSTGAEDPANTGSVRATDRTWVGEAPELGGRSDVCRSSNRLYCFEQ
jgi:hypothetical protein